MVVSQRPKVPARLAEGLFLVARSASQQGPAKLTKAPNHRDFRPYRRHHANDRINLLGFENLNDRDVVV